MRMTFLFCGFIFDSSEDDSREMPVASSNYWLPDHHSNTKGINLIGNSAATWMSPYSRVQETTTERHNPFEQCCNVDNTINNNNNSHNNGGSGVVIIDGCKSNTTTARRFLRWFGRIGQPVIGKTGDLSNQQFIYLMYR